MNIQLWCKDQADKVERNGKDADMEDANNKFSNMRDRSYYNAFSSQLNLGYLLLNAHSRSIHWLSCLFN